MGKRGLLNVRVERDSVFPLVLRPELPEVVDVDFGRVDEVDQVDADLLGYEVGLFDASRVLVVDISENDTDVLPIFAKGRVRDSNDITIKKQQSAVGEAGVRSSCVRSNDSESIGDRELFLDLGERGRGKLYLDTLPILFKKGEGVLLSISITRRI